MMPDQVRKWLRQQSKDFYAAGFDALAKRWDKSVDVGGGYVQKQFFWQCSNITRFTSYIHLWRICWLSLVVPSRLSPDLPSWLSSLLVFRIHFYDNVYIKNIRTSNYVSRDQKHNAHSFMSCDASASDTLSSFCDTTWWFSHGSFIKAFSNSPCQADVRLQLHGQLQAPVAGWKTIEAVHSLSSTEDKEKQTQWTPEVTYFRKQH
jgi:hypothetical protein